MDAITKQDPKTERQAKKFLCRLVACSAWLGLATVLAALALVRLGDDWWIGTLVMFSPRWIWAIIPILVMFMSATVRRRSLVPGLLSLVLAIGPVTGLCIPMGSIVREAPAGSPLRILTCNMHWTKTSPGQLDGLVSQAWPDVVALQEWRTSSPSSVLTDENWFIERAPGLFLASRHPIGNVQRLGDDSLGEKGSAIRYDLDTPSGRVSVISLHLASPREGLGQIAMQGDMSEEGLKANSQRRKEQSEFIAREAKRVTGPIVIVGDFNTPPESVLFETAWKDYADAFGEAGLGWGYTFVNRWTRVRIDHILVGGFGHASRCWVAEDVGSPHRPVLADIAWPEANHSDVPAIKP